MNKMLAQSAGEAGMSASGAFAASRASRAIRAPKLKAPPKAKTAAPTAWASTVPPCLIRNNAANEAALAEFSRLGRLMDARKATPAEAETAKVLLLLIEDYERKRFGDLDSAKWTPLERLRFLMEESGTGVVELGLLLGDRSLGTRVLSGERELSKTHVRKLAEHFKLAPGYFL
jgi:antitoxin component HigA of HigAB toxin-antitoxin module